MGYQDVFQEDKEFSFEGYQVVRREFFAHTFEPALTIRGNSIFFNTACIRKCENVVFVQLLINQERKKIVIRPCGEDDKDAVRWCVIKGDKGNVKLIHCELILVLLSIHHEPQNCYFYRSLHGYDIRKTSFLRVFSTGFEVFSRP